MSPTIRPLARQQDLVIQAAADELLVFDKRTDKAFVLSHTAAVVWRACNGTRTAQEIAEYLSRETPTDAQTVWYALGQMQELLQAPVEIPRDLRGMSRRKFLQRAGLVAAATAVPVVISIVAPAAAHAQSAALQCCICVAYPPFYFAISTCNECPTFCASYGGELSCTPITPGVSCP